MEVLKKSLEINKLRLEKVYDMKLKYEPKFAAVGRLSPVWQYNALVTDDCNCNEFKLRLIMDCEGKLIRGLEGLKEFREDKNR